MCAAYVYVPAHASQKVCTSLVLQVVLIGDHRQLGPCVKSERTLAAGLGVSLFLRFLLLKQPSFRLEVQYRCANALGMQYGCEYLYGRVLYARAC